MVARARTLVYVVLVFALVGCAGQERRRLDRLYGAEAVRGREHAVLGPAAVDYRRQVRPILEARCVVCHACYDAHCQLDLASAEGIDRGATRAEVYDPVRLRPADPTRLFEDAADTAAWRAEDFHPVLNERSPGARANLEAGLLHRFLELKRAHPVEPGRPLPADVDLSLGREDACPRIEQFPRYARRHPERGMPYGLPGLSEREHAIVTRWLVQGALHGPPPALPPRLVDQVARWEAFFNQDSLQARLAARYLYEHLFVAHLHFDDGEPGSPPRFFELVRSRTPPGRPLERVATRRPYDDPGVARPWYRLVALDEAIVAKNHLPYRLDPARMARWRALFLAPGRPLERLPSYAPEVASNPFVAFRDLPAAARYRFMLDEAEFTLMGFIKGAVCRGPIALNVIEDRFWVFFVDPQTRTLLHDAGFLHDHADGLRMPAARGSLSPVLAAWLRQSSDVRRHAHTRREVLGRELVRGVGLDRVWDGDGRDPDAALTVFRHHDSASVVKGMVGAAPKTAWVLDYPLLERIHYLLVAGFDVYGNVGHQLTTRAYMDFLRMEAEFGFLMMLPEAAREAEREHWYRDTGQPMYRRVVDEMAGLAVESTIRFAGDRPKHELYRMLAERLAPVREDRYALDEPGIPEDVRGAVRELSALTGTRIHGMPHLAFLLVPDAPDGARVFTIVRDVGHTNVASPFFERDRLVPGEDAITVVRGFVGAHPNAFYVVERARLGEFVARIAGLRGERDQAALQAEFAVGRTDPELWPTSDRLVELYRRDRPVEAGWFDLSRYGG